MNHEPFRTQLLLAVTTSRIQAGGFLKESFVHEIYAFVDEVIKEETRRAYDADVSTLTSILASLRDCVRNEQWKTFRITAALFLSTLQEDKNRKNRHLTGLLLKASELLQREGDMTPEDFTRAVLTHFEHAKVASEESRDGKRSP